MNGLYWLEQTIAVLPAFLAIYTLLGIPWSLLALPRRDWQDRVLVVTLGFIFGSALVTVWMLILGTIGAQNETALMSRDNVLIGVIVLAFIGIVLAGWKARRTTPIPFQQLSLFWDERLLIVLIIVAVVLRWLTTSFWSFTSYDPLWVFGYEGRLYSLLEYIPNSISYYPQYVPLQYTFGQLMYGDINDHAARAVIPILHIGSILVAYLLGKHLFNRRVGIWTAAIWGLYPHVGDWAHVGDLEIPVTFLFTAAALFFLMAWQEKGSILHRRTYAVIAGLVYGVALWTKPTAGALVWGVTLVIVVEWLRLRGNWRAWYSKFEIALIMGLGCIPLGGVWYIRNILLGHNAIDFPLPFWLTQATRSGDMFGWFILVLVVVLLYILVRQRSQLNWRNTFIGLGLIVAGLLPSMPLLNLSPIPPAELRMQWWEWFLVILGSVILGWEFVRYARSNMDETTKQRANTLFIALLLVLPYFITFFYSYSYHYRLSFAIVPLLILPTAVIIGYWFTPNTLLQWNSSGRRLFAVGIVLIALPGVLTTLVDTQGNIGWLWEDTYPDDDSKTRSQNGALMDVVDKLTQYQLETGSEPRVAAPGEERLPFFFPLGDIDTESLPTQFEELQGHTHFLYSEPYSTRAYLWNDKLTQDNAIVNSFGRVDVMQLRVNFDNGTNHYQMYELDLDNRLPHDSPDYYVLPQAVLFGDDIQLIGEAVHSNHFWGNNRILVEFIWQARQPIDHDWLIYVHLINGETGELVQTWDQPVALTEYGYYSTRFWEPEEHIRDSRFLQLQDQANIPNGEQYFVRIGFYDLQSGERLPVTINGEEVGDGYDVSTQFRVDLPDND